MGIIIKNGIEYLGGNTTLAENVQYDNRNSELEATNIQEAIDLLADGAGSGNALEKVLTQAEYDALGDEKYTDNITYYISDADEDFTASNVEFDGSKINMKATSVQEAIEQIYNLTSDIVITLIPDNWILDEVTGLYKQDIELDGLKGNEFPIMLLISETDEAKAAWDKVNSPELSEGLMTFTSNEKINVEIMVVAKGIITTVNNVVADVTDINAKIQDVETTAAAADNKAEENAGNISTLEDRVTEAENSISELNGNLNTVKKIIAYNGMVRHYIYEPEKRVITILKNCTIGEIAFPDNLTPDDTYTTTCRCSYNGNQYIGALYVSINGYIGIRKMNIGGGVDVNYGSVDGQLIWYYE